MNVLGRLFDISEDDDQEHGLLIRVLLAIRGSFLLSTIATGVLMIASGVAIEFTLADQGVVAAFLVIWGVSALLYGLVGYLFVILIYR